jgi:hypothetical protein
MTSALPLNPLWAASQFPYWRGHSWLAVPLPMADGASRAIRTSIPHHIDRNHRDWPRRLCEQFEIAPAVVVFDM